MVPNPVFKGWVFVHVPRTGGTALKLAINKTLFPNGKPPANKKFPFIHKPAGTVPGEPDMKYLTIFRDPWTRAVSLAAYQKNYRTMSASRAPGSLTVAEFEGWVFEPPAQWYVAPQAEFLGPFDIQFVLRTESLTTDYERFMRLHLGQEPAPIPVYNTTRHENIGLYYRSEAVQDAVRERFSRDFDLAARIKNNQFRI